MSNDKAKSDKNNKSKADYVENSNNSDYSSLTKSELLNIGKSYNLKNISSLTKSDLIEKIREYQEKQEDKIPEYKKSPYSSYSKQQLSDLAKEYKIKNYSRMTKVELIKAIDKYINSKPDLKQDTIDSEQPIENNKVEEQENKLESLNMTALVSMAKDLKIKGYSKLSKLKLIKSISDLKTSVSEKVESIKENITETTSHLSESIDELKSTVTDKVSEIKGSIVDSTESLSKTASEVKNNLTEKVDSLKEGLDSLKENIKEGAENLSTNIIKTKDAINYIASEMKDAFNQNPDEFNKNKKVTESEEVNNLTDLIESDKKDLNTPNEGSENSLTETEKLEELTTNAETIEKIAQKTELTFTDRREANSVEEELKHKILLTPSKFGFGKTNEEYLLKDEESIELPELYEEDKIVLLPVDPTKMFVYWDISTTTINTLIQNNIKDFYLKVNNVTGIIYNGTNANSFTMEKCRIDLGNWYLYPNGGGNFCVELGYIAFGNFNIITKSNTIMVPAGQPSSIIADTFVIAKYPKPEINIPSIDSNVDDSKIDNENYYDLDNYKITKNLVKKMTTKMPIFAFDEIHQHFIDEYKIIGEKPATQLKEKVHYSAPKKLETKLPAPIVKIEENIQENLIIPIEIKPIQNKNKEYYKDNNIIQDTKSEEPIITSIGAIQTKETVSPSISFNEIKRNLPDTIYSYFESLPGFSSDKMLVGKYFYRLPGEPQKAMRVYYEWVENNIPYRKEFFWISDIFPEVHQNIYKVSWGPTWIKEFVGGSEQLRYIGASERFLGSSDIYLGGSEYFIESSGRFLGGSEEYIGGSDNFTGNEEYIEFFGPNEKYFDWNDFLGSSDNLGGSETIQKMEQIESIFSNEFIDTSLNKKLKIKANDYKGIKNRYRL